MPGVGTQFRSFHFKCKGHLPAWTKGGYLLVVSSTDPPRLSQALKQLRTWQILLKTTYIFTLGAVRRNYFVHKVSPKINLQVFFTENQERLQSSLKFCCCKWAFLFGVSSLVNSLNVLKEDYFKIWANISKQLIYSLNNAHSNVFYCFSPFKWNR